MNKHWVAREEEEEEAVPLLNLHSDLLLLSIKEM